MFRGDSHLIRFFRFIDVYFLVKKEKFTTEKLIELAKIKDPGFDLYWLGVAFEKIDTFREDSPEMFFLNEHLDFKELQFFFNEWREKISKQLLS